MCVYKNRSSGESEWLREENKQKDKRGEKNKVEKVLKKKKAQLRQLGR